MKRKSADCSSVARMVKASKRACINITLDTLVAEDSAVLPTAVRFMYEAFRIPKNGEPNLPKCQIPLFIFGATAPNGPRPPYSRGFLDHTQRHTTVGRTPLDG